MSAVSRDYVSGVRLLFDVPAGVIIQTNKDNRFESLQLLPKFRIETNLFRGWVGLQVYGYLPAAVTFGADSPIRRDSLLTSADGLINVEWGFGGAMSLCDGIIAIGWAKVMLDERRFKPHPAPLTSTDFVFVTLQPISTIRTQIRGGKE